MIETVKPRRKLYADDKRSARESDVKESNTEKPVDANFQAGTIPCTAGTSQATV